MHFSKWKCTLVSSGTVALTLRCLMGGIIYISSDEYLQPIVSDGTCSLVRRELADPVGPWDVNIDGCLAALVLGHAARYV